jgi:hypothetical protein
MEAGIAGHLWGMENWWRCFRTATVSETIYNRKAAIRNTVIYAAALVLSIIGLVTRSSWLGYILTGLAVVWAIGGLTYNWKAIRQGFVDLDNPNSN